MGSLGFWPLTVFLPISMHIAQNKIPMWSPKWIALHTLQLFCLGISTAAMIGAIVGIIEVRSHRISPCHLLLLQTNPKREQVQQAISHEGM